VVWSGATRKCKIKWKFYEIGKIAKILWKNGKWSKILGKFWGNLSKFGESCQNMGKIVKITKKFSGKSQKRSNFFEI
jgi:hypothetical protein